MKLLDILKKETILDDLQSTDKKGVLDELAREASRVSGIQPDILVNVLLERERLGSTGIGGGIAIPHGKLKDIEEFYLGFGLSRKGVDFESMDGYPARIFFLLLTPENAVGLHLKVLARISRLLKDEQFMNALLTAEDRNGIHSILQNEDEEF